ncbi:MAG TPA: tetratricopeptide repeat protein [Pyrinomonadaceae bacterium]|jgi:tetratricopeptide (TPR) repeat protein
MLRRFVLPGLLVLLFFVQAAASQKSPTLTPVPSDDKQSALIREGVALHDHGDYDGAISKYQQVLSENPDNVTALYEMAYAHSMKKDYRKSLEIATRGAQYKSDLLVMFYLAIGNSLDQLGEPKKAVEVYKSSIKQFPAQAMLHYNLAVTYLNLKKPEDARKSLKTAVMLNPKHPTSHLLLAINFFDQGYKTPALFAAARFLVLEPKTPRSDAAIKLVKEVLRGGVSAGNKPNEINISVNMDAKKDEGDFGTIELMLGLTKVGSQTDKNKEKTEIEQLVEQVETVLSLVAENDPKKNSSFFVHKYYIPYFVELKQKGFVEPFVYHTFQRSNLPGVNQWITEHSGRVMQFLAWSNKYDWPKAE